jgi:hypothetical protein
VPLSPGRAARARAGALVAWTWMGLPVRVRADQTSGVKLVRVGGPGIPLHPHTQAPRAAGSPPPSEAALGPSFARAARRGAGQQAAALRAGQSRDHWRLVRTPRQPCAGRPPNGRPRLRDIDHLPNLSTLTTRNIPFRQENLNKWQQLPAEEGIYSLFAETIQSVLNPVTVWCAPSS